MEVLRLAACDFETEQMHPRVVLEKAFICGLLPIPEESHDSDSGYDSAEDNIPLSQLALGWALFGGPCSE